MRKVDSVTRLGLDGSPRRVEENEGLRRVRDDRPSPPRTD